MGPRPASSAHSPWPPRPAAARCVIRAFRAEDRLSLARPQPDAGERAPGLGSAAGKELAREEEEDGIVWLRSALGPAERSPGPRARCARGPQSPAAPASGGVCPALPCSLVRIEGRGGREPRGRGQNPPRTLGTSPGCSGLGPPAAASGPPRHLYRGSGRIAGSWGGGQPAKPLPLHAAPPSPAHPVHLGLQDPYSGRGPPPAAE